MFVAFRRRRRRPLSRSALAGMKTLWFIATSVMFLAGCANEGSELVIRDAAGNVVATADLRLPDQLPAAGQDFEGRWQLKSSTGSFPADSTANGKYSGIVHEQGVSIDLNPGVSDNNVVLSGSAINGSLSGNWHHATFVGSKPMGSFTITRPSENAR